jgi:outer membrane lipoprotein-sorting protein
MLGTSSMVYASTPQPESEVDLSPLRVMLTAQKDVKSLSADFTQTRALRTLRSPLVIRGKFWFQAPEEFRWELGIPPKTIIIGNHDGTTIIQPSKRHAEKKPQPKPGSFFDSGSLGMMRFPGGGDFEQFKEHVQVFLIRTSGSRCHVELLPRDPKAARGLASINLDFDRLTGQWLSLEIVTREGSSILNEFSNVQVNPKIPHDLFHYDLSGLQVTDEKN